MAFTAPVSLTRFSPSYTRSVTVHRSRRLDVARRFNRGRVVVHASTPIDTGAREVTAEELDDYVKASVRPIVLDAYATWCGPCQMMKPELDKLAAVYKDAVDILKFDTEKNDAHMDMASAMMVRGLPTLFFIKDSQLIYRMEGALPAESLELLCNYFFFDGPKPEGL